MSVVPAAPLASPVGRGPGRAIRTWLIRALLVVLVLGLIYLALRDAHLGEVLLALGALQVWQIALILVIDVAIHSLMAFRWWIIVRTEDRSAPFLPLVATRLAAFGISYFTLGPQVGGEPLQLMYLRRHRGTSMPRATASVLMDKLLELLANFFLLILAVVAIARTQLLAGLPGLTPWDLIILLCLAAWPATHILLLVGGYHPLTALVRAMPFLPTGSTLTRHVRAAERLAGQFCRRHPRALVRAVLVSILAASASVMEYSFITSFLLSPLSFWQNVSAWSAGWLSFLFPTPAGLGALEASQVLVLGALGVPASRAIAVAFVMRARDLAFGGAGLLIAAATTRTAKSNPHSAGVLVEKKPSDGTP